MVIRAASRGPKPPGRCEPAADVGEHGGVHGLNFRGDSSMRTGPGLVRPCIKERMREGVACLEGVGGDATMCVEDALARGTISFPLRVTGEWLNGVKAICALEKGADVFLEPYEG